MSDNTSFHLPQEVEKPLDEACNQNSHQHIVDHTLQEAA